MSLGPSALSSELRSLRADAFHFASKRVDAGSDTFKVLFVFTCLAYFLGAFRI
jgi:hypothetical protein